MDFDTLYQAMTQSYQDSTGYPVNPDSDLGIRMQVLAGELLNCYGELEQVQLQMFPQTATGSWLDLHGQARGLTRTQEQKASGVVTFYRTDAAPSDYTIPLGTVVGSSQGSNASWVTTQEAVLPQGSRSVDVPVECTAAGSQGNVLVGRVDTIISTLPGISYVTNTEDILGGSLAEDDESFRKKILDTFLDPATGVNLTGLEQEAMQVAGMHSAKGVYQGAGLAVVYVASYDRTGTATLVSQVQQRLNAVRPLGYNLVSGAAENVTLNLSVRLYPNGAQSSSDLIAQAQEFLRSAIYGLGIGESFNPYVLGGQLCTSLDGVEGVEFLSPTGRQSPQDDQIYTPGTISVTVTGS